MLVFNTDETQSLNTDEIKRLRVESDAESHYVVADIEMEPLYTQVFYIKSFEKSEEALQYMRRLTDKINALYED